jgi:hypothetical protein
LAWDFGLFRSATVKIESATQIGGGRKRADYPKSGHVKLHHSLCKTKWFWSAPATKSAGFLFCKPWPVTVRIKAANNS